MSEGIYRHNGTWPPPRGAGVSEAAIRWALGRWQQVGWQALAAQLGVNVVDLKRACVRRGAE